MFDVDVPSSNNKGSDIMKEDTDINTKHYNNEVEFQIE